MAKRFGAGIHIAVKRGEKYLVLKRSADDEDDPEYWDMPGGKLETWRNARTGSEAGTKRGNWLQQHAF